MTVAAPLAERVSRVDVGSRLGKFSRTGAGAVRVPATTSRTGVQVYDGIAEYRPAEEVFHADSLASLTSVPVTINHPPVSVTAANAAQYQRGLVTDAAPEAHVKVDADINEWVRTNLIVTHADLIACLEQGSAGGVSCGYTCDLDPTPGVAPDGTPYKFIQRNIRFNHVAVLTADVTPRAGAAAKVRLDGEIMKIIQIDGVEYEFGSEKHLAKLATDAKAATDALQAKLDTLQAKLDTLQAKHDAATAASGVDKLDELVLERFKLLTAAAKLLPKGYDTKGKSNADVRKDALEAALGAGSMNGKSPEYIAARFDGLSDPVQAQYTSASPAARADAAPTKADSDDEFRKALAKKDETK